MLQFDAGIEQVPQSSRDRLLISMRALCNLIRKLTEAARNSCVPFEATTAPCDLEFDKVRGWLSIDNFSKLPLAAQYKSSSIELT